MLTLQDAEFKTYERWMRNFTPPSTRLSTTIKLKPKSALNPEQQAFVDEGGEWFCDRFGSQIAILDGAAGTGKTYSLAQLLKRLELRSSEVVLCAPTHQAASVLAAALLDAGLPKYECKTVHSLYGIRPDDYDEEGHPIYQVSGIDKDKFAKLRLILVDERSMLSALIVDILMGNTPESIRILFTGDGHQLPPVEKSQAEEKGKQTISAAAFEAGEFPDPMIFSPSLDIEGAARWELRQIMRQDGGNLLKVGIRLRELIEASDELMPEVLSRDEEYSYRCTLSALFNEIGGDESLQQMQTLTALYQGVIDVFQAGGRADFLSWTNKAKTAASKYVFNALHPDAEHDFPVGAFVKLSDHWRNGGDEIIRAAGAEGFVYSVSVGGVPCLGSEVECFNLVVNFGDLPDGTKDLIPMRVPTKDGAVELKRLLSLIVGVKGCSGTPMQTTDLLTTFESKIGLSEDDHSKCPTTTTLSQLIMPGCTLESAAKNLAEYLHFKMISLSNKDAWKTYYALNSHFGALTHGYATTIHKAQGSTYQNVFILNDIAPFRLGEWEQSEDGETYSRTLSGCDLRLAFRLLYVALTRPKQKAVFYERGI
jgi:AAA domain